MSKTVFPFGSKSKKNLCLSGFWDQSQANSALYIAFWSVEPTDFKNVIIENIPPALSEDAEVAEVKRPRNSKRRKFYYKKW